MGARAAGGASSPQRTPGACALAPGDLREHALRDAAILAVKACYTIRKPVRKTAELAYI
jgi:hypothetical protein